MKTRDGARNWRYFPPSARYPNTPRLIASRCGWTRCNCIGRGNGAPAGLPAGCTSNSGLITSGKHACRIVEKAPVGDILQTLVVYRLLDPGSEWRLHRLWFEQTAMADLLGADYALVEKNALYRCLDKLLPHKRALFHQLTERWQDLFGVRFDILLYDLTSTYFESPPPQDEKTSAALATAATSGATACKSSLP